tara:strand:+ start:1446 stop:2138 length:693 start_codon:yes stop_codon:yes gene_type:complete
MISEKSFVKNLNGINKEILGIQKKTKQVANKIRIIAVTKKFDIRSWKLASEYSLDIGESRVQEASQKERLFQPKTEKHLIGHLQRNKVSKAIEIFDVIQTIDSLRLAKEVNKKVQTKKQQQRVFLQININEEKQKTGFKKNQLFTNMEEISTFKFLKIEGIMCLPKKNLSTRLLRSSFSEAKKIRDEIKKKWFPGCMYLSMGMSSDYIDAIKEGATHIRIGTSLFGSRIE